MTYIMHRISPENTIIDGLPCASCGADLVGCNPSSNCPQCGDPISQSLVGHAVCRIDENEFLSESIPCRGEGCGYSLKGIDPLGECPECKTPIAFSLEVDLLRYANPGWLKSVATGVTWYFITMVLTLLMIVVMIFMGIILSLMGQKDPAVIQQQSQVIQMCMQSFVGIFSIIAIFLLTAVDPGEVRAKGASAITAGAAARVLQVLSLIATIIAAICTIMAVPHALLYQIPAGLMGAFAYLALLSHMQTLAWRIPDESMAERVRVIKWAWLACVIVGAIGGIMIVLSGITQASQTAQSTGGNPFSLMTMGGIVMLASGGLFACVGGVGNLVFTIWVLVIMYKLRQPYVRAAQIALAT